MRKLAIFSILVLTVAVSAFAAAQTLPQMFRQVQEEFARGDYRDALATLDRLDEASRQPGFENDRAQLAPAIAFFRGASLAQLGRTDEAKEQFAIYLTKLPTAQMKEGAFPKAVEEAFHATRREMSSRSASLPDNDLASVYASFRPVATLRADASWADSPVRRLMTPEESAEWALLEDDAERWEFVTNFWARRDPTPGTPENEFRAEIERRILFADNAFASEDLPGRKSERALVFTFLGPPSYVARAQMRNQGIEALRGRDQGSNLGGGHQTAGAGSRSLTFELSQGIQETWQYRSGDVPQPLAFPDLTFEFITRKGYGTDVLQKSPEALQAIEMMIDAAAKELNLPM
ncbi:MAG: GWxTD domain-containing protein [Thermoanaerobaculia bacterium]